MQVLYRRYLTFLALAFTVAIPFLHFELPINIDLPDEVFGIALKWIWTLVLALIVFRIERRPPKFLQFQGFSAKSAVDGFVTVAAALVLSGIVRDLFPNLPSGGVSDVEPSALWIRLARALP